MRHNIKRTIQLLSVLTGALILLVGCCVLPEKQTVPPTEVPIGESSEKTADRSTEDQPVEEPDPKDPGLYVRLFAGPDGPVAEAHVDVFKSGTDNRVAGDWVNEEHRFRLESGTYDVVAYVADARVRRESVEVSKDEYHEVDIVLDAGTLSVRFLDTVGGDLTNVEMWIHHSDADDESIFWDWKSEHELLVPAGSYDIAANVAGSTVWKRGVEVAAGGRTDTDVILNAGTLHVRILDGPDGELTNAELAVYHADDEDSLYWDYRQEAELLVPAGTYTLKAKYEDGTEKVVEDVMVAAGETTVQDVSPEKE